MSSDVGASFKAYFGHGLLTDREQGEMLNDAGRP